MNPSITSIRPILKTIWIIQAEHWAVPGIPLFTYDTEARANAKAAKLVNALLAELAGDNPDRDDIPPADATPTNWESRAEALSEFVESEDGASCGVWKIRSSLNPKD